jgi:adenine-specific DNA-methyltransferase
VKKFRTDVQDGLVPLSIWPHTEVGTTGTAKNEIVQLFPNETPFSTPKSERLLQRIVHIASNPGDVVLDCFVGSGTTAAVAHKMGRRWVAVENRVETVATFALPRLTKVVHGEDAGGITADVGWEGGGGFRLLDVAPSMFVEAGDRVYLADDLTTDRLGEATAAQLGFEHELDAPFSGRKGMMRLAVVDGLVNEPVVTALAGALPDGEKLTVCATAYDPDARAVLRALAPGSNLRKIPQSLLDGYAASRPGRLQRILAMRAREADQNNGRAAAADTAPAGEVSA